MAKKYFADTCFFKWLAGSENSIGRAYYALVVLSEMGEAKNSDTFKYPCSKCGNLFPPDRVNSNMEEVSTEEALKNGLIWESNSATA
jgi:hypothetical protein